MFTVVYLRNDQGNETMKRTNKLYTQTELANKLNVSFSTINRWENGKIAPNRKAELALEIFAKENNIDLKEVEGK